MWSLKLLLFLLLHIATLDLVHEVDSPPVVIRLVCLFILVKALGDIIKRLWVAFVSVIHRLTFLSFLNSLKPLVYSWGFFNGLDGLSPLLYW